MSSQYDLRKMRAHYPKWDITKSLEETIEEIICLLARTPRMKILITGVCAKARIVFRTLPAAASPFFAPPNNWARQL